MSTNGFDITAQQALAASDLSRAVHVEGPDERPMYFERDGQTIPVTITVLSSLSKAYRRAEANIRKRAIKLHKITGEGIHDDQIEKAVACIVSWDGFFAGGQVVQCNPGNAAQLFRAAPYVLTQVNEAIHDRASFFESGSPS
jgi:hypothetical protein